MVRIRKWGFSPRISYIIILTGALTLFIARASALTERDLKKVVALSTLSQLGLMVFIVGLGQPLVAFFHLNTHAFFKSLLFIGTGDIIHSIFSSQDMRHARASYKTSPNLSSVLLLSNLRLSGIPFLAGFYSKDMFLEVNFLGPLE